MSSSLAYRTSSTAAAGLRRISPATATPLRAPALQHQQRRGLKDRLDGPFGQQAPPKNPGGPDAIRRNWMWAAGIGLLAVASVSYMTRSDGTITTPAAAAAAAAKEGEGMAKNAMRTDGDAGKSLGEMSGRSKTGMGGFRSE